MGPRGASVFFFIFYRVGGPVGHELRQYDALTKCVHFGFFINATICRIDTARGLWVAGRGARAVNDFFYLKLYY